ncbi:MAG TPA: hypothetical protein VFG15_07035 [Amycolatopsis sp.]|nr:hypothetical protein [Amycolatopsis sp.]
MSAATPSLVHWTHSGIDAPHAFTVIDFDYLDVGRGVAYGATLIHPDLEAVGRIANDGSGGPTTFHPYDHTRFGHHHLDQFLARCLQDDEPLNRHPDARNNLLESILTEADTADLVREMRANGGFLVRSYIPDAGRRFGPRRAAPKLLPRIRALRIERGPLAGYLNSDPHDPPEDGAYWQMFNGEDWVRLLGPGPLTPEQLAARTQRAGELAAEMDRPDDYHAAVPFDDDLHLFGTPAKRFTLVGDSVGVVNDTTWCRCRRRKSVIAYERWSNGDLEGSGTIHAAVRCRALVRID